MRSTVVVGYDRTLASGRALLEAGREAACRNADVIVVTAYPTVAEASAGAAAPAAVRDAAEATAAFGAGVLRHRYPGLVVGAEAVPGVPQEVLATAARGADLLVLGGPSEDGRAEHPLGWVTECTLARTPCPVMVVHAAERYPRGVVLAAIDVGDQVEEVVNFAFAEARFRSARLRAVSVLDPSRVLAGVGGGRQAEAFAETEAALDQILAERRARCGRVQASGEVVDGPPASVLAAAAKSADLVVAGARRRDGERFGVRIGQVTDALLRGASCPVIVVPRSSPA